MRIRGPRNANDVREQAENVYDPHQPNTVLLMSKRDSLGEVQKLMTL